jgi:SAM-dependent methyltransferase
MSLSIQEINIASFSSSESVEIYSRDYLRSGEEYAIRKYMPAGSRILDIGCGTGRTTVYIARNGCAVIGGDVAAPLIDRARVLHPGMDFRVMDAARLDFPAGSFDAVFFSFNGIDNFSTLEDRRACLRELARVVKPGGYVIYSSHNSIALPRSFSSLLRRSKNILFHGIGPHWQEEQHGFGRLFQYYNNVWNERRRLRSLGFDVLETVGSGIAARVPEALMPFIEKFPIYVLRMKYSS